MLLTIFYAGLNWFPSGRISISESFVVTSPNFKSFTGLLTLDGMLNGRLDISASAFRHLVLPGHLECCTRPALRWIAAELGPYTRVNVMDQYHPDHEVQRHPERYPGLQRRLTGREFDRAVAIAREEGLHNILV